MLGAFEDFAFDEETIALKPGDLLVISSDGISEAMNSSLEQFGEHRLQELIVKHRTASPNEIIERIIKAVKDHAGDYPQSDDMTLVAVRRLA